MRILLIGIDRILAAQAKLKIIVDGMIFDEGRIDYSRLVDARGCAGATGFASAFVVADKALAKPVEPEFQNTFERRHVRRPLHDALS